MARPAFANRTDMVWTGSSRELRGDARDIAFTAHAAWYATGRWRVTGISTPALLPAGVTVYVARRGAHGYWRNAPLRDYFGYCDVPALMPMIVGAATCDAIARHDHAHVALHIRDGVVETTSTVDRDNQRVIEDHLAIHRALVADHAVLVKTWHEAAEQLGGTLDSSWPPQLTVPRLHGPTTIALRWPESMALGSEASLELIAHARGAPLWQMKREPTATPNCLMLAQRPFLVTGDIPFPIDQLAELVERTEIVSIVVRRHVTVRIARSVPNVSELEALLDLIGALCNVAPYR